MFGILHDDYQYSQIKELLNNNVKTFLKSLICNNLSHFDSDQYQFFLPLTNTEILEMILLIINLKSRIQLTYFSFSMNEMLKEIDK